MISVMREDSDPRFKGSKYLLFLDKLSNGDWQIKGDQIIKNSKNQTVLEEEKFKEKEENQVGFDPTQDFDANVIINDKEE